MASKSTTTEVEIFGSVYHVRGQEDSEYLQELAVIVDRMMREVAEQVSTVDRTKIAILTALNLADELSKCREGQQGDRVEIKEKVTELTSKLEAALEGN